MTAEDPTQPAVPRPDYARALAELAQRVEIVEKRSLSIPPAPPSSSAPPAPRPSLAAKAAKGTAIVGVGGLAALGLLTAVAEFAALKYPEQMGPIVAGLQALLSLARGGPQ